MLDSFLFCFSSSFLFSSVLVDFGISRSEQAPGSGFHPRDESDKIGCGCLGPSWCNKKVDPKRKVPCGSYELLVSNVAHEIKEKLIIEHLFSFFLGEISLKFQMCFFFRGETTVKNTLREIVKLHSLPPMSFQCEFNV